MTATYSEKRRYDSPKMPFSDLAPTFHDEWMVGYLEKELGVVDPGDPISGFPDLVNTFLTPYGAPEISHDGRPSEDLPKLEAWALSLSEPKVRDPEDPFPREEMPPDFLIPMKKEEDKVRPILFSLLFLAGGFLLGFFLGLFLIL